MLELSALEQQRRLESQNTISHRGLTSLLLIAVTGFGRDQDREQARAAGFDNFVTKPLGIDTVRDLLDRARKTRMCITNQG